MGHTPGAIDAVGLMMLAREAPYPNLISGLVPAMPMLLVWGEEDTVNLPSAVEKIRMAVSSVVRTLRSTRVARTPGESDCQVLPLNPHTGVKFCTFSGSESRCIQAIVRIRVGYAVCDVS